MNFNSLDYGTKPTTVKLQTIEVSINPEIMISDFADAYAKELYRLNPVRAKEVDLTSEELNKYFTAIIAIRVDSVLGTLKSWREARLIAIPAWIQHSISQLGEVVDREKGLRFRPKLDYKYDIQEILQISERLQSFESDGLSLHVDAFPREKEGNEDVMGMVIVDDYVQSIKAESHPVHSYVAAFLGYKLVQEQSFSVLYRIRYDDVAFIANQLIHDRNLRQ